MGRIRLAEIRWPEVAKAGSGRLLPIATTIGTEDPIDAPLPIPRVTISYGFYGFTPDSNFLGQRHEIVFGSAGAVQQDQWRLCPTAPVMKWWMWDGLIMAMWRD